MIYQPVASIIAVANRFLAVAAAQTMPWTDYHIIIRRCRHTQLAHLTEIKHPTTL
ncbi:hypothetical protein [[Phormidium] sp. ETS-05]|uniref:hypothetical protein n=1 Tax=[Phormidium] sp. ETS-05 TaxID=222819 RepID=UPI0018EF2ABE|nr:hypothetical protein [[Phormidium] sp. ETS-05]